MSEKGLTLYEMTSAMLNILEADEVDEVMMEEAFANIVRKDASACHFIKTVEASAAAMKEEAKRLTDRARALENRAKWTKEYIQQQMERLEVDTLEAGSFSLRIQNNPPSLVVDEKEIPDAYRIVTTTIAADKERIKSDLKRGIEIPGAALTVGRSLRIR